MGPGDSVVGFRDWASGFRVLGISDLRMWGLGSRAVLAKCPIRKTR